MKLKSKIKITQLRNWINFLPAIILSFFLSSSFAGQAVKPLAAKIVLPKIVIASLEKNQIPLDAVSVSIIKINDKNITYLNYSCITIILQNPIIRIHTIFGTFR